MSLGVGALQVGGARKVALEEEGGHHLKRHCHTEKISGILQPDTYQEGREGQEGKICTQKWPRKQASNQAKANASMSCSCKDSRAALPHSQSRERPMTITSLIKSKLTIFQ